MSPAIQARIDAIVERNVRQAERSAWKPGLKARGRAEAWESLERSHYTVLHRSGHRVQYAGWGA